MSKEISRRGQPPRTPVQLVTAAALNDMTYEDLVVYAKRLQTKYANLQAYTTELLIRDVNKRESDVKEEIAQLKLVRNSTQKIQYLQEKFTPYYFLREPDTHFKIELCKAIIEFMSVEVPEWTSSLIEGIANSDPKFYEYTANPIDSY
ncbi:MAG: hypothetical protein WC967_09350 [Balneolaceae bacterium]